MTKLILIKHALPVIDPSAPAHTWQLGDVGVQRCYTLANLLAPYLPAVLVSSPEPKASATAQALAEAWNLPWTIVPGLEEHHRHTASFLGTAAFHAIVQRFFAQPTELVFGEETADAAHTRFSFELDQVLEQHPSNTVMVVAHGTVIALWASRHIAGIDGFTLWEQLGLPSCLVIDLASMQIETMILQVDAA